MIIIANKTSNFCASFVIWSRFDHAMSDKKNIFPIFEYFKVSQSIKMKNNVVFNSNLKKYEDELCLKYRRFSPNP